MYFKQSSGRGTSTSDLNNRYIYNSAPTTERLFQTSLHRVHQNQFSYCGILIWDFCDGSVTVLSCSPWLFQISARSTPSWIILSWCVHFKLRKRVHPKMFPKHDTSISDIQKSRRDGAGTKHQGSRHRRWLCNGRHGVGAPNLSNSRKFERHA